MKIKLKNFEILIKGLKSLKRKEWNFGRLITEFSSSEGCGTVCCAVGWTPRFFPKKMEWYSDSYSYNGLSIRRKVKLGWTTSKTYSYLFGIPADHEDWLFNPRLQDSLGLPRLNKDCTVGELIKVLRMYIRKVKKGDYEGVSV